MVVNVKKIHTTQRRCRQAYRRVLPQSLFKVQLIVTLVTSSTLKALLPYRNLTPYQTFNETMLIAWRYAGACVIG